jgi:superfamily II DNA/RNA helicase
MRRTATFTEWQNRRAGNDGRAITLVTSDDIMSLYEIEEHIGVMIEKATAS